MDVQGVRRAGRRLCFDHVAGHEVDRQALELQRIVRLDRAQKHQAPVGAAGRMIERGGVRKGRVADTLRPVTSKANSWVSPQV